MLASGSTAIPFPSRKCCNASCSLRVLVSQMMYYCRRAANHLTPAGPLPTALFKPCITSIYLFTRIMQTLVFRIHQSIGLELGQVALNLRQLRQRISSEPSVERPAWYLGTWCALAFCCPSPQFSVALSSAAGISLLSLGKKTQRWRLHTGAHMTQATCAEETTACLPWTRSPQFSSLISQISWVNSSDIVSVSFREKLVSRVPL